MKPNPGELTTADRDLFWSLDTSGGALVIRDLLLPRYTVPQLRSLCCLCRVSTAGAKSDLAERLGGYLVRRDELLALEEEALAAERAAEAARRLWVESVYRSISDKTVYTLHVQERQVPGEDQRHASRILTKEDALRLLDVAAKILTEATLDADVPNC